MAPHHWKRIAADNGAADPNADVRPGRSAKTVLGAIRGLMATAAAARDDGLGGLVAALAASNVYAVNTNEGLIDIATGINNVPAAITTPFLLRATFDTTLANSATNTPHLKVDGFDCGPILRRDGSALADGDLVGGVPVVLLGDMAQAADTKVTRVRVLEVAPSELQSGPVGECVLTYTSPTVLTLKPVRRGRLFIGGAVATVPAGGIPLANTGLLAADITAPVPVMGPFYYGYAFVGANGTAWEASTTPPAIDPNFGHKIKGGDPSRTLIGMLATDGTAGSQGVFVDTPQKRYVASYFNRTGRDLLGAPPLTGVPGAYTPNPDPIELSTPTNRVAFLTWDDEFCDFWIDGCVANYGGYVGTHTILYIDGAKIKEAYRSFQQAGYSQGANVRHLRKLSEGLHWSTVYAQADGGGSYYNVQNAAAVRS